MRDDNTFVVIVFACALVSGMIGLALGIKVTRSDFYTKCVNENKTMVYEEVHKLCTERSR